MGEDGEFGEKRRECKNGRWIMKEAEEWKMEGDRRREINGDFELSDNRIDQGWGGPEEQMNRTGRSSTAMIAIIA